MAETTYLMLKSENKKLKLQLKELSGKWAKLAMSSDMPSKSDIKVALDTINNLALFVANHGCMTQAVPGLVNVMNWLGSQIEGNEK